MDLRERGAGQSQLQGGHEGEEAATAAVDAGEEEKPFL
jgi:hypothetical protein